MRVSPAPENSLTLKWSLRQTNEQPTDGKEHAIELPRVESPDCVREDQRIKCELITSLHGRHSTTA
jgi:hypothetical protein